MNKNHIEIDRKYVILMPNMEKLMCSEKYKKVEIVQIYIESEKNVTHRVRQITEGNNKHFFETKKMRIDRMSAYEDEREISEASFLELKKSINPNTCPIVKTRHSFVYQNQLFEIDVYPEWKKTCIMETELDTRDVKVEFPLFIRVISEVTGNKNYSNASMAHHFPDEII